MGAILEGVAGEVGDNEGEEEVEGVGSGATVTVKVRKGVSVPPLTPPRAVTVPILVPLGRPVVRGVKERLNVGSIEGEEEENGEELEIPL